MSEVTVALNSEVVVSAEMPSYFQFWKHKKPRAGLRGAYESIRHAVPRTACNDSWT